MGRSGDHDMHEIVHSSKAKWESFYTLIQKFIEQGYQKEDEDIEEKEGLNGELISKTVWAELKPPNMELPRIKLEATETYGRYDFDRNAFEEWESPRYELKASKKGARSENFNDRWEAFELM